MGLTVVVNFKLLVCISHPEENMTNFRYQMTNKFSTFLTFYRHGITPVIDLKRTHMNE